jgi:hypothetical protein
MTGLSTANRHLFLRVHLGASEKFSDNSLDDISPGLDILEDAISYRYCACCCGGAGFLN